MSVPVKRAMVWTAVLLTACASACVAATPRQRVEQLLAAADADAKVADAEAKLTEAEKIVNDRGSRFDASTQLFLRAEVYQTRGRVYAKAWKAQPAHAALRNRAFRASLLALDEYVKLADSLEDRLARLEDRITGELARNRNWKQVAGELSRTNYQQAWTLYNIGVIALTPDEQKTYLRRALDVVDDFTDEGYRSHPIIAQCFLIQALCHYELKEYAKVLTDLKKAVYENTPGEVFKRMTYLRIKSYQALDSDADAEKVGQEYFRKRAAGLKPDTMELRIVLARVRSLAALTEAGRDPVNAEDYQKELDKLSRVLYSQGEPWRSEMARITGARGKVTAFSSLVSARERFAQDRFKDAAETAAKGLALADGATDAKVIVDLRYTRAAALFNDGQWLAAHQAAHDFVVRHGVDPRARDLCRRALTAGLKALKEKPPLTRDDFRKFLAFAESRFPGLDGLDKARWYRANLLLTEKKYTQARAVLQGVAPGAPVYLLAQYGLALAAYRQAETALAKEPPDDAMAAALLGLSADAVERFVTAAAGREMSADEREAAGGIVDIAVASARRLLRLTRPRTVEAVVLLDRIDRMKSLKERAASERLALRLEANIARGKIAEAVKLVDALVKNPEATGEVAHVLAGVVTPVEREVERLTAAGKTAEAQSLARTVVNIYVFILRYAAAGDDLLRDQEDAIRQRLAGALVETGRYRQAKQQYEWLVRKPLHEKSGSVIRGLAVCHTELREYPEALKRWQVLARGLKRESKDWYEARYYVILCHKESGEGDRARTMLQYFLMQNPEIKVAPWDKHFRELARKMGLKDTG